MSRRHVVSQGDCLSSIAARYGFASFKPIWEHSENADLRNKRRDPAVIAAGDEVVIPDPKPKTVSLAAGKRYRLSVKLPQVKVRVHLRDRDGEALANQDYVLEWKGGRKTGTTTGDGLVEQSLPASIEEATVQIAALDLTLHLRFGTVDPVDSVTGAQLRLNQLGFDAGAVDGDHGPRTEAALERFQQANDLQATGKLDDETSKKLAKIYGC